MIKRNYYYYAYIQTLNGAKQISGVATFKSWFADPSDVFSQVTDFIATSHGVVKEKIEFKAFNKV